MERIWFCNIVSHPMQYSSALGPVGKGGVMVPSFLTHAETALGDPIGNGEDMVPTVI